MKCTRDLPHCKMSVTVKNGLRNALAVAHEDRVLETGDNVDAVEKMEGLTARVVSNMEMKQVVHEEVSQAGGLVSFCCHHIPPVTNNSRLLQVVPCSPKRR